MFSVKVIEADFDVGAEYKKLTQDNLAIGAAVYFVGLVRDFNLSTEVTALELEHYPAMTEKALADILEQAKVRWPLLSATIIHRVGRLELGDQIVFVGVASQHREDAFQAAEFLMDYLKNSAPIWKKEFIGDKSRWIEPREKDLDAQARWK